ncbi:MAG TPA: PrgI family protein [Candidatus Saccharimonadales bacterium]|nr:PrgI family protein [Candidatus Saccharimonadales bacterium]
MATYKLIQDVEAEDHILGPLTLRQFIFGLIGAFCWYLSFIMFVKHVYPLLIITVPPALFTTFFAIPFGRDQPTEVWALAKLRFWFKPRRRIWDQSGMKELVTITVPKKVERILTKGFSQSEVQSRLKALANTLDTRGWAVKNISAGPYSPPSNQFGQSDSDRLIDIGVAPQEVPNYDVQASDDILDEASNPVAQQFQSMITQSSQEHRQHLMDEMNEIKAGQQSRQGQGWFMGQAAAAPATQATSQTPQTTPAPSIAQPLSYAHLRTLRPLGQTSTPAAGTPPQNLQAAQPAAASGTTSGAAAPDPAILSLANNNDLNVSTLAREAYKAKHDDEPPRDEVVVSLH